MRAIAVLSIIGLLTMLLGPALTVRADNVQNNVVIGGNDTITAGGSTTITFRISSNGSDGCNIAAGTNAKLRIAVPAGVTTTPAATAGLLDVTFPQCGN